MKRTICIDPGHGMGNRRRGVYDTGAVYEGLQEASIVMTWANELRGILMARGAKVIRTRVDDRDPAPVSRRDDIARSYGCDLMLSLHCNAATGQASGTEVYYRGEDDQAKAAQLAAAVSRCMGIPNRGAKTEAQSQHPSLAVMEFTKCWLIELGFIDSAKDRDALLNPSVRKATCKAIADILLA